MNHKERVGIYGCRGPQGEANTIEIRDTITSDSETKAAVIETRVGNYHVLDFLIPRGKQGEQGEKGDQDPTGPINEGTSEKILFASYAETNISGVMMFKNCISFPTIPNILVSKTKLFYK